MSIWQQMQEQLERMEADDLRRNPVKTSSAPGPRIRLGDRDCICLCANDYLCLCGDTRIKQAAAAGIQRWGLGAGASRLVSGTTEAHVRLEAELARFKQMPDVVLTSTGWMANHAAIHALAGREDLILCDKLDHASILDAAGSSGATVRTYHHRDTDRLEKLCLRLRGRHKRCLIVTDSLFSMDGDLAPLAELADIKERFDAVLLIDEAHATGVLGKQGRGAAELLGVEDRIDVVVGTLSKALGGLGGFIAGPVELCEMIRNTSRPYIYTTAPPAALCQGVSEALKIVQHEPQRRKHLLAMAQYLRDRLGQMGISALDSRSQIVPIVVGDPGRACTLSGRLLEAGYLVPAIRPPTVPRGSSRLRVSLCSGHTKADISAFCTLLAKTIESIA